MAAEEGAVRVLLTGGAGFIGSQLARTLVGAGHGVVVLDALTYAGRRENLDGVGAELVVGDVCDERAVEAALAGVDAVVHAAAESHVARSLADPAVFLRTNAQGTAVMLGAAQRAGVERFLLVSTDEVFGEAAPGQAFSPEEPHRPGNPYAASKAAAEALVHAWRKTWGYEATILRCTNNYGPRQHPEKAIPWWIRDALAGGPVRVQGQGLAVRDWLFVEDFARGALAALERWQPGATWHFSGRDPRRNRDVAQAIADRLGGVELAFIADRPGQDARYALDDEAARRALGWAPEVGFAEGLARTIRWHQEQGEAWRSEG